MTGSLTRRAATALDVRAVVVFYSFGTKIIRLGVMRSVSRETSSVFKECFILQS
jgi:hypothetical protein